MSAAIPFFKLGTNRNATSPKRFAYIYCCAFAGLPGAWQVLMVFRGEAPDFQTLLKHFLVAGFQVPAAMVHALRLFSIM